MRAGRCRRPSPGARRRAAACSSALRLAEHSRLLPATRGGSLRVCGGESFGAFAHGERRAGPAVTRHEGRHVLRELLRGARGTGERAVRHGAARGGGRGTRGGGVGRVRARTSAPGSPRAAGKVCRGVFLF